jgi:hypothetical protein
MEGKAGIHVEVEFIVLNFMGVSTSNLLSICIFVDAILMSSFYHGYSGFKIC